MVVAFGVGEDNGVVRPVVKIAEVAVRDIDVERNVLIGVDGRSYVEAEPNTWVSETGDHDVAYLGTGRHGGGIVLRPLFVRCAGMWLNTSTGKPAPSNINLPLD